METLRQKMKNGHKDTKKKNKKSSCKHCNTNKEKWTYMDIRTIRKRRKKVHGNTQTNKEKGK